jgi:type II restriction enzyme
LLRIQKSSNATVVASNRKCFRTMAKKDELRQIRFGTVINTTSKRQEMQVMQALHDVEGQIKQRFGVELKWEQSWKLADIVASLRHRFPEVDFHYYFETSSIKPDGGVLSMKDHDGKSHPIVITEKKNQGTNDMRVSEGLARQAQGNAIERLGKNVIGLKTAMMSEGIFPFVCFGDGCDFTDDCSILDRVVTIAQFGHLNKTYLHPQGPNNEFLRGSFYFREGQWTREEMAPVMFDIAKRSVQYYFSKYGEEKFLKR